MLANLYLHYVLDKWFKQEIRPRPRGAADQIRYGDNFVMGCTAEGDARRILDVLPKRFGKYGLKLHPEKTRIIPFKQPSKETTRKSGESGSGGFECPATIVIVANMLFV